MFVPTGDFPPLFSYGNNLEIWISVSELLWCTLKALPHNRNEADTTASAEKRKDIALSQDHGTQLYRYVKQEESGKRNSSL
jgi:hypothetical protein